ncbi:MAG: hypothetical protein FJW36_11385 [Acidobacteria bacterium]|nr:hypothetical protein [Acidobacteriota bacterium]
MQTLSLQQVLAGCLALLLIPGPLASAELTGIPEQGTWVKLRVAGAGRFEMPVLVPVRQEVLVSHPQPIAAKDVDSGPLQEPAAPQGAMKLNIVVISGDGAINNIKSRTAREMIVEVRDENNKPVAGASVVFLLPDSGPGLVSSNGSRMLTSMTDANGRAAARGLKPNGQSGRFNMQVRANYQQSFGQASIAQTNMVAVGAALSGLTIGLIAVGAAVAAGTVYAVTRDSGPGRATVGVNPGTPSAGAPR